MKNISKSILLLVALAVISCGNPKKLEIVNLYSDGVYIMNPATAESITPEQLRRGVFEDIIHLNPNSCLNYEGSSFSLSDDFFDSYVLNGKFTICYTTDKSVEKAEKENMPIKFTTFTPGFEMKNLNEVAVKIENKGDKPEIGIKLSSKTGF